MEQKEEVRVQYKGEREGVGAAPHSENVHGLWASDFLSGGRGRQVGGARAGRGGALRLAVLQERRGFRLHAARRIQTLKGRVHVIHQRLQVNIVLCKKRQCTQHNFKDTNILYSFTFL